MADTTDKETTLTEEHVIIIACVCGVIIITLLIILFCFIFRRRRNAAKAYQGGNQGDPPPYTAVPPNKKPQVYDNQGMESTDMQLTVSGMRPSAPSPSFLHAQSNGFTNSSYGPLELYPSHQHLSSTPRAAKDVTFEPWSTNLHLGRVVTLDRQSYGDAHHLPYQYNTGVDGYPNREPPGAGSVPQSPSKDKYIGLQDRSGGGDPMMGAGGMDGGYNPTDPSAGVGKPKKVIYEVVV